MFSTRAQHKLHTLFRSRREIALAYLFGSLSKSRTPRKQSDIDIAILLTNNRRGLARLAYLTKIAAAVQDVLATDRAIDVVILNEGDALLAHQVLKYGVRIFERKYPTDRDFRVRTMTRYFEAKRFHDFFYERYTRRK